MERKKEYKKRMLRIAVALIVGISLIQVAKKWEENQLRVRLETMVTAHNIDAPKKLNEQITIDSASTDSKITFIRHYTIKGITQEGKEHFAALMKNEVVKTVKESKELEILKKDGIVFRFTYADSLGKEFASISVTPEEYK